MKIKQKILIENMKEEITNKKEQNSMGEKKHLNRLISFS